MGKALEHYESYPRIVITPLVFLFIRTLLKVAAELNYTLEISAGLLQLLRVYRTRCFDDWVFYEALDLPAD